MENEKFLSIKGRLRRKDYLIRVVLLSIPLAIINVIVESTQNTAVMIFLIIFILMMFILITIQSIKRLHDTDMSGWYYLVSLIPIVNVILGIYLIFEDGKPGLNKYGEDPKGRQSVDNSQ